MSSQLPPGFTLDEKPEQSWGDWAYEGVKNAGRAAVNAASFGMADRAVAGLSSLGGRDYDTELASNVADSDAARERSPYASVAGDVAGSLTTPGLGAAGLATRLGGRALARGAAYGATGAITGAAQGAGNTYTGNPADYVKNALTGGALGGAFGAAGGAAFGARPRVTAAQTPTTRELYEGADAAYDTLRRNGAVYEPPALANRARQLEQEIYDAGYHPTDSPGTWRAIERMQIAANTPGGVDAPASIEAIRQGLNKIPKGELRAADRDSATIVRRALGDFIENPPQGAVRPGTEAAAQQAGTEAARARELWGGARRGHLMDNIITNAENRANSIFSGRNVENTIRQEVAKLQKLPAPGRRQPLADYTAAEREALDRVVNPGRLTDHLRTAGNMLGGGGGVATPLLSVALGGGGGAAGQFFKDDPATGAVLGAAAPLVGLGLRGISNRRARGNIAAANDLIHQRNPIYRDRLATAGTRPGGGSPRTAEAVRDAVALAIMNQTRDRERN